MVPPSKHHVLIVEDHRPTAKLLEHALSKVDSSISVEILPDGRRGLSRLREDQTPPDIVLLDLELPEVNGFRVLKEAKSDPSLRHIPIIVLSANDDPRTIRRCYHLGSNGFISKPSSFDHFVEQFESVVGYWFSTMELPGQAVGSPEEA